MRIRIVLEMHDIDDTTHRAEIDSHGQGDDVHFGKCLAGALESLRVLDHPGRMLSRFVLAEAIHALGPIPYHPAHDGSHTGDFYAAVERFLSTPPPETVAGPS